MFFRVNKQPIKFSLFSLIIIKYICDAVTYLHVTFRLAKLLTICWTNVEKEKSTKKKKFSSTIISYFIKLSTSYATKVYDVNKMLTK